MELKEFNDIIKEIFELRKYKATHEEDIKAINDNIRNKEAVILAYFEENELEKFASTSGLVYSSIKVNVKKTDEEILKKELVERGIYDTMAKVNAQTLAAYVRSEREKAIENGAVEYDMPGVEISLFNKLGYRTK